MCLLACNPASARRTAARLIHFCVACLALSAAIPSLALHLHLAAHAVNTLDFVRGFLLGLAITLAAISAFLRRRARQNGDPSPAIR